MSQEFFRVEPVHQYQGAQYPSAYARRLEDDQLEKEVHPLAIVMALLLVIGLIIGASGCYLTTDRPHGTPPPDGGPGDGGPDPDCNNDDLRCDGWNLQICVDESWATESCDAYCSENFGPEYYSNGCDASADDPCLCEYGMIDGFMAECEEGDVQCYGDDTIGVCEDGWDYTTYNCDELCDESGPGGYSTGCNADAEDPCLCEYDIIEGDAAYCSPGEIRCHTEETLIVCTGYDTWDTINCEERCDELYGAEASSTGCDASAEEPCLCVTADSGSGGGE